MFLTFAVNKVSATKTPNLSKPRLYDAERRPVPSLLGVLLRVEDTEFAKQLLYCILYCMVRYCFPLFIVLSFCVYCLANSVFYLKVFDALRDRNTVSRLYASVYRLPLKCLRLCGCCLFVLLRKVRIAV